MVIGRGEKKMGGEREREVRLQGVEDRLTKMMILSMYLHQDANCKT